MINLFVALFRLALLAISAPVSWLICVLFFPILPLRYWAYIVRSWAYVTLWINGVKLEITGQRPSYLPANTMVIANHMTWLDIVILYCICFINFIGKIEMRKWPLLRTMIKAGGTIFINRNNKRDILKVNPYISQELIRGKCVGLFPEGAINDGRSLLPFKSSLFEATILAKTTIIPVVLQYYRKDGEVAYEASYANCNLIENISRILRLNGLKAKAAILAPVHAGNFNSREELATYLYTILNEAYFQRT